MADVPDIQALREQCQALAARLEGRTDGHAVRSVYLEMVPLVGAIQAAVRRVERSRGTNIDRAMAEFEGLTNTVRAVGHDIRLSSPAALSLGVRTALEQAGSVLDLLERGAP